MKILLAEADYARRLSIATVELLEYSKQLGSLEKRHAARAEFLAEMKAEGRIMLAPKPGQDPATLYTVDSEGVAHISIMGQLTPVAEQDICGGYAADALTEYGYIVAATQAADADSRVVSLAYHVNSPGGYLAGLFGALSAVASASKPTQSIVGDMAASAAYWLIAATGNIQAESLASRVGSIGVLAEEYNQDRALAARGIDHIVHTSTDAPLKYADTLTPEGRAQVKAELDQLHEIFRSQVAEGRNVTEDKVNTDFGRGSVMTAQSALAAGMIDGILPQPSMRKATNTAQKPGVAVAAGSPAIKPKGKIMTLEQLKADHPEVFAQAVALGKADGIKAEQDRVRELSAWKDGHNADTVKVAEEAIAQGKTFAEVSSQLMSAAAKGPKATNGANPPAASTATLVTPAGGVAQVEGLSDDEVAALMRGNPAQGIKGMTIEEIRANTTARKEA